VTNRTLLLATLAFGAACAAPGAPAPASPADPAPSTAAAAEPAPALATGHPDDSLIPRALLFGDPDRTAVRLSPDGKQLAWLAPHEGVRNVWVAPVGKLEQARVVTAEKTRPLSTYYWAETSQHLLYLQDQAGDENYHLFAVDLGSGKITDLTPFEKTRAQLFATSHKKPTLVMVGLNDRDPRLFDLHEVDLATGQRKLVVKNEQGFTSYAIDNDLRVRFAHASTPDGGLAVFAPGKPGQPWTQVEEVPSDDLMTTAFVGFDKKNGKQYVIDSRGRDTGALFEVDLKSKQRRLLAEDPRADVGDALVHPTEMTVQAVSFTWDRVRWIVLDKKIQPDLDALARADEGEINVTSRSTDDRSWLVAFTGDRKSTRYHLYDRKSKKSTFLFAQQEARDSLELARMHPVIIKSRDGLDLVSYLSLPPASDPEGTGRPAAPVPLVLLVHGGPWGRDSWGYSPLDQLLTNRGYAVLSVNFRGSTGFGKNFVNAGNGEWGKKMHDDLLDAVEWAVAERIAPRDRIAIMGGSYGGYAALVGLAMTPDVFAAGVDIVGPSSIVTLLEAVPPYWQPMIAMFKKRVGDFSTPEGKAALEAVSPLTHAAKIKKPLLIAQGANDPRVKQAESEQIVTAMQKAKIPVSYALFPDEGHGFARKQNSIAFFALAEAFLSAHLGGKYQPITPEEIGASTVQIKAGKEGLPGVNGAK
jgi:dipeptidyl aminopeptidase/acylaminoacyl peptidase